MKLGMGVGIVVTTVLCGLLPAVATGQDPKNPVCIKLNEETPEQYGPTDIGATLAGKRLQVAVNSEGTLSVLRWPSRSYWEQLKYFTTDRDDPDLGLNPNEGAFSGLALELEDGSSETVWLRDLSVRQRYASPDSDTVITRFRSGEHRFRFEIADVVPRRHDVLIRRHQLRLGKRSDVRSARLITLANLNPTASKRALLPTEDWCEEVRGTDRARYVPGSDALVYEIAEIDQSIGERRSVAVAIGANTESVGHQVGADSFTEFPSTAGGPPSAFEDAADGELSGNGSLGPTEVDAALAFPIEGRRPVKVVFALGDDGAEARTLLDRHRDANVVREARRKRRSYLRWLRHAPLPRDAPEALDRLARRSLVSLRQAIETNAGEEGGKVAIVASLSTQSPYFLDWIRDGAFFNEALDLIGKHGLVRRHNAFYAEVQHKLEEGAPPGSPLLTCASTTPDGNWFMTNYADGGDAGVFPWEIDEAGFGAWTLFRHYEWLERVGRDGRHYLAEIYPALRRTADFLVAFRDPSTGLTPGTACEDDNFPKPGQPTMHASGPVLLAMRSAEKAARILGRAGDLQRYAARRAELEAAIEENHRAEGGAWTRDFGDGGWALWPIQVKPYDHPRMLAQAELAWERVKPRFEAPGGEVQRGQYEVKALHGMAHLYREVDPDKLWRVKRGLRWIAEVQAAYQDTGILGEAWYVRDGELISVVAQPHVWEQILVYLAAVRAYGRTPYEPGPAELPLRRR